MKVEPGSAVTLHFNPVGKHCRAASDRRAIAASLANDRRGLARDRGFIHRGDAFDDFAVAGDGVARFDENDVVHLQVERRDALDNLFHAALAQRIDEALRMSFGAGSPQGVSLRLAAPLRHRLREIGEQHREPEPGGDLPGEHRRARANDHVANEEGRDDNRDGLGDEDHGILGQATRIELHEGVQGGALHDCGIEQAGGR